MKRVALLLALCGACSWASFDNLAGETWVDSASAPKGTDTTEFGANMEKIRTYAAEYGRANARIESGLILLCRIAGSREKALEEMRPMLAAMGQGAEQFLQRSVFGSPEDVIGRLSEYVAQGLDKFVLWPIADPEAWPKQIELVGREIATHYARQS